MKNKSIIEKAVLKEEKKLVCYDNDIEKLSKKELEKVVSYITETTDVIVNIRKKTFVVEIVNTTDNEVDLTLISKEDYINRYGSEKFDDEE